MRVGKGLGIDVRTIKEITISAVHFELSFEDCNLTIRDLKSKYGTLKLVRQPIIIPIPLEQLYVGIRPYQIDNTILYLSLAW
jgi:hypothetical protein